MPYVAEIRDIHICTKKGKSIVILRCNITLRTTCICLENTRKWQKNKTKSYTTFAVCYIRAIAEACHVPSFRIPLCSLYEAKGTWRKSQRQGKAQKCNVWTSKYVVSFRKYYQGILTTLCVWYWQGPLTIFPFDLVSGLCLSFYSRRRKKRWESVMNSSWKDTHDLHKQTSFSTSVFP